MGFHLLPIHPPFFSPSSFLHERSPLLLPPPPFPWLQKQRTKPFKALLLLLLLPRLRSVFLPSSVSPRPPPETDVCAFPPSPASFSLDPPRSVSRKEGEDGQVVHGRTLLPLLFSSQVCCVCILSDGKGGLRQKRVSRKKTVVFL